MIPAQVLHQLLLLLLLLLLLCCRLAFPVVGWLALLH